MVVIRKAKKEDAAKIALYLLDAMEEIVYKFIDETDPLKAMEFMMYFTQRENNQYSYQNCWVADMEGKVVAAVNVYDGAKLSELRKPVINYIKNQFKRDLQPEDETQEGELYIDTLGVDPEHQCKGIGSAILQKLIEEYVINANKTLGLLVDKDNPVARKLYIKKGFKIVGKKVLLGKELEHFQFRPINK